MECGCGCAVSRRGPHRVTVIGDRRYRIRSTGGSSHRFGPCAACGKHAIETFAQSEEVRFEPDALDSAATHANPWTYYGGRTLLGHETCLIAARRTA